MKIKAKNCPHSNHDWYDVTDIAMGQKGYNSKICISLDCPDKKNCDRMITEKGYPSYDQTGTIANSYLPKQH